MSRTVGEPNNSYSSESGPMDTFMTLACWDKFIRAGIHRVIFPFTTMGIIGFILCWVNFNMSYVLIIAIALITGIGSAILCLWSLRAWCIFCLCIPTLTGQTSRKLLLIFLTWILWTGPIQNTEQNLQSVATTSSCLTNAIKVQADCIKLAFTEEIEQKNAQILSTIEVLKNMHKHAVEIFRPMKVGSKVFDNTHLTSLVTTVKEIHKQCNFTFSIWFPFSQLLSNPCRLLPLIPLGEYNYTTLKSILCSGAKSVCPLTAAIVNATISILENYTGVRSFMFTIIIKSHKSTILTSNFDEAIGNIKRTTLEGIKKLFVVVETVFTIVPFFFSLFVLLYYPIECWFFLKTTLAARTDPQYRPPSFYKLITSDSSEDDTNQNKWKQALKILIGIGYSVVVTFVVFLVEEGVYYLVTILKDASDIELRYATNLGNKFEVSGGNILAEKASNVLETFNLNKTIQFNFNPSSCYPTSIIQTTNWILYLCFIITYFIVSLFICVEERIKTKKYEILNNFYPKTEHDPTQQV